MDYEKEYKMALERCRWQLANGCISEESATDLFRDLYDSEDERMVRALIRGFENWKSYGNLTFNLTDVDDILAYLEKQKEPRDYRKLYEEVVNSDWFKANYKGKSLGEDQPTNSEIPKVSKPEWTEADEKMLSVITYKISQHQGNDERSLFTPDEAEFICEIEDKFKSLRPSWKPSEEQMEALQRAVNKLAKTDVADSVRLSIMYDNLKKLM